MSDGLSDYLRDQKPIVPRFEEQRRLVQHYARVYQPTGSEQLYVDVESAERYRLACSPPPYFWLGREAEAA